LEAAARLIVSIVDRYSELAARARRYRSLAHEARELARKAKKPRVKFALRTVAGECERRAEEAERHAEAERKRTQC
jgi:hypothetical protein